MEIVPIRLEGEVRPSDPLAQMISSRTALQNGDVVVIAQKIVSKQEGRIVDLSSVSPSLLASGIACQYGKDPRVVQLVLSESERIVRMRDGILIVRTGSGLVCANAGIDQSNVPDGYATLLPSDPDESACRIRAEILKTSGRQVAVIVSDTLGRPFRMGQANCAIGVAGMEPILDYAGTSDSFGRMLQVTAIAVADELASAAELVMEKASGCPVAVVKGYRFDNRDGAAFKMVRPRDQDLFL